MKFNVVVGNPPYNNDMYLEFVENGFNLSKQYTCMITPAKWQSKVDMSRLDDKNCEFRHDIVQHLKSVIYYPEVKDIFDILLRGGISILLLTKYESHETKVINKSLDCEVFNSDITLKLNENRICLLNFVNELLDRIKPDKWLSSVINTDKSPYGLVKKSYGQSDKICDTDLTIRGSFGKVLGYLPRTSLVKGNESVGLYKCVTTAKSGGAEIYKSNSKDLNGRIIGLNTLYKYMPNEVCSGDYFVAYSGDEKSVDSFISYMSCKLINLLYFAHCTNSNINSNCFDLVPYPESLDCVYEDKSLEGCTPDKDGVYYDSNGNKHCSLYVKYKLTDEEISIIESVIRERK